MEESSLLTGTVKTISIAQQSCVFCIQYINYTSLLTLIITEYNTDVKSIMKELLKQHSALEKTEQELKNTKLDLKRATGELEDGTDPDSSKLAPPVSEWLLVIVYYIILI